MTLRAVVLGVLGSVFIAGFGYLNDQVWHLTFLVGNHFPIGVFGVLLLVALTVNPLLFRLRPSWRLSPAELGIAVSLVLVACSIPGSSLMRHFLPTLALPAQYNENNVGWKRTKVLSYVPPAMLPAGGRNDEAVVGDFISGLGTYDHPIRPADVPWEQWLTPMMVWTPLILLTAIAVICMSLVVHRQWASRELLAYPVARVTASLIAQEPGHAVGPVYRRGLFWLALVVVLAIRIINGIFVWHPGSIQVPMSVDFRILLTIWPTLNSVPAGIGELLNPVLYPTAAAFCYFLASEVGFSLGISQIVFAVAWVALFNAGVELPSNYLTGGPSAWQLFGSCLGVALLVGYTGRHYYWQVLKQCLSFRRQEGVESYAAWAARVFLLCVAGLVGLLVWLGLEWPFAVGMVGLMMLLFLVMARVNAEAGLFYFQPYWQPVGILLGLFGAGAMGPKALIIVGLLCTVLTIDPRECLMPFFVNALKISDDVGVKPGRIGLAGVGVFALALAVALPVVFWADYNYGVPKWDTWGSGSVPKFTFDAGERAITELTVLRSLDQSRDMTTWQRMTHLRPNGMFLWSCGVGLGLVLVCSVLRLRFPRWPIHPVLFLVMGTAPLMRFGPSFFLGWVVRSAVIRLGGGQTYQRFKPLMIGVIAGDLLGGLTFMLVGAIYHAQTGLIPKEYVIFPT